MSDESHLPLPSPSPAETQTALPPAEKASAAQRPRSGESFGRRLGRALLRFLRTLLRLVVIALLLGSFISVFAMGVPFVIDNILAPLGQHTHRLQELENRVNTLQTQVDELNRQLETITQEFAQTKNNERLTALEKTIETYTDDLNKLEEMQAALETALQETNEKTLQELKQEVLLTRVLDTLGRARLYLAQSNFGLAKTDVQTARALLAELQAETQDTVQGQALQRLDLALNNLPSFPVVAAGDLEIAWQLLISGQFLETAATETPPLPTPTADIVPSATPTP